jgi:hypothetical protein
MKKNLLVIILMMVVAFGSSVMAQEAAPAAAKDNKIGLTAGVDYFSKFFWRGYIVYGNSEGVFFPYVNYSILDTGFSVKINGEYPSEIIGDGAPLANKANYAMDFGINYAYNFNKLFTVGAGFVYVWKHYSKNANEQMGQRFDNSFGIATVFISADSIPLSPTLKYQHDFHTDDQNGTRDANKDYYIQLSISHAIALMKNANVIFGASGGYFDSEFAKDKSIPTSKARKGISDVGVSVALEVIAGAVKLTGNINYAYVPDGDWYMASGIKDKHYIWAGFGASYSL